MFRTSKKGAGFTLIELLVVVAIVSLLSSIVMASLGSARNKAKDATIKEEVNQLVNLMELNYNDYGSYCKLSPSLWVGNVPAWSGVTCDAATMFSGTYATNAVQICKNIYSNAKDIFGNGAILYVGGTVSCNTAYSIMVGLNDNNWYCSGSSGAKGEYAAYTNQPGCYNNP